MAPLVQVMMSGSRPHSCAAASTPASWALKPPRPPRAMATTGLLFTSLPPRKDGRSVHIHNVPSGLVSSASRYQNGNRPQSVPAPPPRRLGPAHHAGYAAAPLPVRRGGDAPQPLEAATSPPPRPARSSGHGKPSTPSPDVDPRSRAVINQHRTPRSGAARTVMPADRD